jgi:alpha-D-ribose 1-methylphosphonate 5-triphosphate synthase subunit PhnH
MILGLARSRRSVDRFGQRLPAHVHTPAWVRFACGRPSVAESMAARFASRQAG